MENLSTPKKNTPNQRISANIFYSKNQNINQEASLKYKPKCNISNNIQSQVTSNISFGGGSDKKTSNIVYNCDDMKKFQGSSINNPKASNYQTNYRISPSNTQLNQLKPSMANQKQNFNPKSEMDIKKITPSPFDSNSVLKGNSREFSNKNDYNSYNQELSINQTKLQKNPGNNFINKVNNSENLNYYPNDNFISSSNIDSKFNLQKRPYLIPSIPTTTMYLSEIQNSEISKQTSSNWPIEFSSNKQGKK